jgi:hypothetical protein
MIKLIPSLLDDLGEVPTVVELGNQTFDPTLSGRLTDPEDLMLPRVLDFLKRRGKPYDDRQLRALMELSPAAQKPKTADYFKALGFAGYTAIDVNSMYGSLVMDLNVDLADTYGFRETYDLVTNNGTGEHIFNQYAVFKNMHQLAKVGGVLLFVLPFYNWLNHGFYNFNPLLFTDLATANQYQIVRLGIGCSYGQEVAAEGARVSDREMRLPWQPDNPALKVSDFQARGAVRPRTLRNTLASVARSALGHGGPDQMSPLPGVIEKLAERAYNINVVAALRKTGDMPFRMPLQGMYAGDNVESDRLRAQYEAIKL